MAREIFALLVGINEYSNSKIPNLDGCLNDVEAMRGFLMSQGAKDDRIICITNRKAIRSEIIQTFEKKLIENNAIKAGDPIIFFFAGHGNRVTVPKEWAVDSDYMTETICPSDESETNPGIPSRTMNELFSQLAASKGNNITAIFDSCHSGTITRAMGTPRTYQNPYAITDPALDREVWRQGRAGYKRLSPGFIYDGMETHVLLAACLKGETAYETSINGKVNGIFTAALIPEMKRGIPANGNYAQLINTIKLSGSSQKPQCGGKNQEKPLLAIGWTDPVPSFALESKDGFYRVEAGRIHGVTLRTEFSIYESSVRSTSDPCVGVLSCTFVAAHHAILGPATKNAPQNARAVISAWKNATSTLKLFFKDVALLRSIEAYSPAVRHFISVPDATTADIVVDADIDSGDLVLESMDPLMKKFDHLCRLSVPDKKLADVLNHISQFRYHLTRGPEGNNDVFRDVGSVGMPEDAHAEEIVKMQMYPLNPDLRSFNTTRNLLSAGPAEVPSSDIEYGIKIVNCSAYGLFPYLFFFDLSNYSVTQWYGPRSPRMEAPLYPHGFINIGLPNSGVPSLVLKVANSSVRIETAILKLFISDVYVDLKHIVQRPVGEIIAIASAENVTPSVRSHLKWHQEQVEPHICGMTLAGLVVKVKDEDPAKSL